ncbi:MAG: hypothetical protein ABFD44_14280, partial [Anaerolineaceae bacterium]
MDTKFSLHAVAQTAFRVLNLLVILVMTLSAPLTVYAYTDTDKPDYSPGETVTIFGDNRDGTGYLAGETVQVDVTGPNGYAASCSGVASETGAWACQVTLPADNTAIGLYSYVTLGLTSGTTETHTFTDGTVTVYDQCANDDGDGYGGNPGACQWINGNLQKNNSTYSEGDATVQFILISGVVPGETHSFTLVYGTTKNGKHAYDFLTTWSWSEDWITEADRCHFNAGCIAYDPLDTSYMDIPLDPNVPAAYQNAKPDQRHFNMRGGTLTNISTPTIISGDYTGTSETSIEITFTVNAAGNPMCNAEGTNCQVAMIFGAHVAAQADWGTGTGAGSISGSPFHVQLSTFDGAAVGSRDNQMQSSAIPANGTITIVKDAIPNDAQDFNFNLTNGTTITHNFALDDDADPTLSNTQSYSLPAGIYTAAELGPLASWWYLTGIVCVDPTTNTTVDLGTGTATINLASAETVTCTFTNTKQLNADLTVSKTATATFGRLYKWLIDKSVDNTLIKIAEGGTATFNYDVKVTPDGYTDSGWAVTGEITVTNPNAFDVAGVNVTDAIDNGGTCTVTGGTNVTVPANNSVQLGYACSYAAAPSAAAGTNTATVTWNKDTYYTPNGTANGTANIDFSAVTPAATNKVITVVDDKTDPLNPVTLGTWNWADGEHIFEYALSKTGVAGKCTDYTNTAVITETKQSDTQKVTVCVGKDLTVSKTAVGSYDRTYLWKITKDADKTLVKIAEGGTATFSYSV